jgi:FKBP-type peptidyl-prolyl cis-trans isomerase 2
VRLHLTLNPRLQGKLHETGEVFDTHSPQDEPFEFTLGSGEVIEGLNSALLGYAQHLTHATLLVQTSAHVS